jgi:raffinose/stachyose/melibiose transport system substrate-binding protein
MKTYGSVLKGVLMIGLVLVIMAACSGNTSEPNNSTKNAATGDAKVDVKKEDAKKDVTLSIMFQKNDTNNYFYDWMQDNIKLFTEQNPHITFDVTANTCCDNYLTVVTTEMAANNLPDIFQGWTLGRMQPFAEAGRLYDLSEDLAEDTDWSSKLSELNLRATTWDGGVYGIPLEQAVEVIFYNKEVFANHNLEVPDTYDDFLHIVDTLRDNNIVPMTVPNNQPWVGTIPYMMIYDRIAGIEGYEKNVMSKEGSWTEPEFIEAANILQELIERGAFEENVNSISMKESEIKLTEGSAGMYAQGTWSMPNLIRDMGDNVGVFNFPDIDGGKGSKNNWLVLPNSALSISEKSENKEEALEFLKFVFSQDRQLELAKLGYFVTYDVETQEGDLPALNTVILDYLSQSTGSIYPWDVPLGVFMGAELNNTTQSLYTGADPKEVFKRLQEVSETEE